MRRGSAAIYGVVISGGLLFATPSSAAPPADRAEVARADKAFAAKRFKSAAEGYEAAFARTNNLKLLLKAAVARHRAGELPKAASAYARILREAPPNDPSRKTAQKELASLDAKLAQLEIKADGAESVTVDGAAADLSAIVYVEPGPHQVEGRFGEQTVRASAEGHAGQVSTVTLSAPEPPKPEVAGAATSEAPKSKERPRPLPPMAVWIGAGVTAVAGGLAIASGLDVLSQRETFDADRSQANLDEGKSKQLRTNVLIAVTGVAAVATGVMAIWFVDWRKDTKLKVGAGPSSVFLSGSF